MDPKVLNFVYFYGFVVLALVSYMLFWRSRPKTSRLKLRESGLRNKVVLAQQNQPKSEKKERQLNVIFQFNGHDFEAFEVLGVPAGSSLKAAEEAYYALLAKENDDSHDLYKLALEAIRKSV